MKLALPVKLSLSSKAIDAGAFATLLTPHSWHGAAAKLSCKSAKRDPIDAVAAALNASVVERQASSASMYAVARGGAHLALLAKLKDGKSLKVDIKSTDAALADAVAGELPFLAL